MRILTDLHFVTTRHQFIVLKNLFGRSFSSLFPVLIKFVVGAPERCLSWLLLYTRGSARLRVFLRLRKLMFPFTSFFEQVYYDITCSLSEYLHFISFVFTVDNFLYFWTASDFLSMDRGALHVVAFCFLLMLSCCHEAFSKLLSYVTFRCQKICVQFVSPFW